MAHLGSLLPKTKTTPLHTTLTHERVNFSDEGILVTLLHTKTIQFGKRRLHIPLLRTTSIFCPVQAYEELALCDVHSSGPAFVFTKKGQVHWLTARLFIHTFRTVLKSGGIADSHTFTGHSFRRGGATWAFQAGVPGELIQVCGDWASDAYKQYLEFSIDDRLGLAALLVKHLPQ